MSTPTPNPSVMKINAYQGGKSMTGGTKTVVKLSSNECSFGPSPRAMKAYRKASDQLFRYPDGGAEPLKAAIAGHYGLNPEHIVCGAGSDELIALLCQAYISPGDEVIYSAHGFLMYKISTLAAGGVPVVAPETDLTANVDALLSAVTPHTRMVFLANPNNPTGTYLPGGEVRRLREGLREDILLILDAAYAEFVRRNDYEAGIELVSSHQNVVMTRTFSKLYGLAGLRLGWAYCPAAVADVLNRVRGPFNVNLPAQIAGAAALEDTNWTASIAEQTINEREKLRGGLEALGLIVTPSEGNFLLIHFPDLDGKRAVDADAALLADGVILRRMEAYGLSGALRCSIGTTEENARALAAITRFMETGNG